MVKAGFFNFWRNGFVSLSSVLVMTITLFVIGSIIFMGAILNTSLSEIKSKVGVNVYFVTSATEDNALQFKGEIEALPEVESVVYTSKEEALAQFKKRHENNEVTLQVLQELDENPLGASLAIRAKDPSQYQTIATFIQEKNVLSSAGLPLVDKVNYTDKALILERLTKIISSTEKLGLLLTLVLVVLSVLITVNTIRLAIYSSREEISVMKLVGASSSYIQGPFIVSGVMYGLIAGILTLILFYPITFSLGTVTQDFFIGLNVFNYYLSHFGQIFIIVMVSGIAIGGLSSYIGAKRYLDL
jgi:cell division transport system permease protein